MNICKPNWISAIDAASGLDALDAVRPSIGEAGRDHRAAQKSLGAMSPDERLAKAPPVQGRCARRSPPPSRRARGAERAELDVPAGETLDMPLPAEAVFAGSVHPVSQVMDELAEIFADMGFAAATGPEIEDDWHNFTALNIPETHPARAMHDTFYCERTNAMEGAARMVLRTHTSPVQIRTMMTKPPIRIIAPGRVYRSDWDATHTPMFHQIEGPGSTRALCSAIQNGRSRRS